MLRRVPPLLGLFLLVVPFARPAPVRAAEPPLFDALPVEEIGAVSFRRAHPDRKSVV